jgi:hypothetical protein
MFRALSGPGRRLPREAKARAAEGEVGDPLTPENAVQTGLKVAKKTTECGTGYSEQVFDRIEQETGSHDQQ